MSDYPFLNNLNEQQRAAVTQIEGPVMVIAGPGTGKTQILASRIAYILEETDTGAGNILCLTYTDAGTIAMRKRLVQMIGPDAHRVSIHTFHGFCNRVIQENQEHFDYKRLDAVSDLERVEYLTQIAVNLDQDHRLKKMKGNVGYLVGALSTLFDWMKMEHVTPEQLEDLVKRRKVEMREGDEFRYKRKYKEFNAGDLNQKKLDEAEQKLDDLVAAALLFHTYQTTMEENSRYDYTDMILWVIDLFRNKQSVLSNYQEKFHFILVDEFQDTSGSQNELLQLLLNYWAKPNVFVVGDDDQSIYRFQGAEVKNVIDFAQQYGDHLKSILLKTNYRSTQNILSASKLVIDQNKERLVNLIGSLDKTLVSHRDPYSTGEKVRIVELQNEYLQSVWIANEIERGIRENGDKPEDFAIIYAKHAHGETLASLLRNKQIPVYLKRSDNILVSESVNKVIRFLTYINKELQFPFSGEFELFELLHFEHFGIAPLTIARLAYHFNQNRQEYQNWRTFLSRLPDLKSTLRLPDKEFEAIYSAHKSIEHLIARGAQVSPYKLTSILIEQLDLSTYALEADSFTFELESLITFLDFVEQESKTDPQFSIDHLLTKIRLMEHHRIQIAKEHVVFDKKGVNLLTAHASKGLEYKHVFVINCIESVWEKRRRQALPFGIHQLFTRDSDESAIEEIRRLFYVAMTRTEDSLCLTYFSEDKGGKEISRSAFIDDIFQTNCTDFIRQDVDQEQASGMLHELFSNHAIPAKDLLDPPFLSEYLQSYKLSVSHLNNYLECPTTFYFRHILRVPSPKNVYMSFGTAIHNALDHIIRLYNQNSEEFSREKLVELYEFYLKKERPVYSEKEFLDFMSLGKNILADYFNYKLPHWKETEKMETEVMIDRIEVDGVPIKGQLDIMEISGQAANVIDYKTGDAYRGMRKLKAPIEGASEDDSIEKRFGGSYWRQIMFYSLLVNNDHSSNLRMQKGEMEFIEPVNPGEFLNGSVYITPENENFMRTLVREVYDRIMNRDFLNGCGQEDCHWCSFVQKHYSHSKF